MPTGHTRTMTAHTTLMVRMGRSGKACSRCGSGEENSTEARMPLRLEGPSPTSTDLLPGKRDGDEVAAKVMGTDHSHRQIGHYGHQTATAQETIRSRRADPSWTSPHLCHHGSQRVRGEGLTVHDRHQSVVKDFDRPVTL